MTKFGIDVSALNGDINFTIIREEIDFVIIRCGYGNDEKDQDDREYENNIRKCEALGIPYGIYFYSYALNLDEADSEVRHCLRLAKKANPTYGVWFDMEDGDGYKAAHGFPSGEMLVGICERFLTQVEAAGYYVGLYASLSWLNGYLKSSRLNRFDKWVAHWAPVNGYSGAYGLWQFTDKRYLGGHIGPFDGNYAYYDYPALTGKDETKPEEPERPQPEGREMKVIGKGVNFREGAYVGAPVIAQLFPEETVTWLWDDGWGWSNCIYKGKSGYMVNEYLSEWKKLSGYKKARILGSNVNMRTEPSMNGAVIGQLQWGNEVEVLSIDPMNWMRIQYRQNFSYIKYDSAYIKIL